METSILTPPVLEILAKSIVKFKEDIGIEGRKNDLIWSDKAECRYPDKDGLLTVAVKSVTRLRSKEETFGLQVEDKTYITNGVLSHNTALVHYPGTAFFTERKGKGPYLGKERFITKDGKRREHDVQIKFNRVHLTLNKLLLTSDAH